MWCPYEFFLISFSMITALTTATSAAEPTTKGPGVRLEVSEASMGTQYLTDSEGRSLYLFERDSTGASTCVADCARSWQPLRSYGYVTTGNKALDAKKIGAIKRVDGTEQVTYAGRPLYYYHRDAKVGDVEGQGVNEFGDTWYLVSPSGSKIELPPKAARSKADRKLVARDLRTRLGKLSAQYGELTAALERKPSEGKTLQSLRTAHLEASKAVLQIGKGASAQQEETLKANAESKLDELEVQIEAAKSAIAREKTTH